MGFLAAIFGNVLSLVGLGTGTIETVNSVQTESISIEQIGNVDAHNTMYMNNPQSVNQTSTHASSTHFWHEYQKLSSADLTQTLDSLAFKVTQENGTERAGTSPLDKNNEQGIYVDILSGEPLFSSRDKFDSGTGWPSFARPITPGAITEHEDRKLFRVRTEVRSAIADNHLGHVFTDGPADRGGLRYCMNGVALEFVPRDEMERRGYGDFMQYL